MIACLLACVAASAIACSTETDTESPVTAKDGAHGTGGEVASCTVKGRTGQSSCQSDQRVPGAPAKNPITCSAGTFCYVASYEAKCTSGCQSDEHCGATERCVRCGDDSSGTCRPCNTRDEEACAKEPAPTPPSNCARDKVADWMCEEAKAWVCPPDVEKPDGTMTCTRTTAGNVWCCN